MKALKENESSSQGLYLDNVIYIHSKGKYSNISFYNSNRINFVLSSNINYTISRLAVNAINQIFNVNYLILDKIDNEIRKNKFN